VKLRALKRRTEIERLWGQGKRIGSPWLLLVVLCREGGGEEMGYLISVSRRRVRRAVARTRLRRLLREAVRRVVQEYEHRELPLAATALVWRAALGWEEVRRLRLGDVLPQIRELFQRACAECR
jgi:ribonuclease P protein component